MERNRKAQVEKWLKKYLYQYFEIKRQNWIFP